MKYHLRQDGDVLGNRAVVMSMPYSAFPLILRRRASSLSPQHHRTTTSSTGIPTTDEMPPRQKRSAAKYKDDSGAGEVESGTKRAKYTAGPTKRAQGVTGKKFTDDNGDVYWEVCWPPPIPMVIFPLLTHGM